MNSSANSASNGYRGCGLGARQQFNLSLRFCTLSQNTRSCCLYFSTYILNNDISCLNVLNNSCESNSTYPGFIHVRSPLTLSRGIFQSNRFDYFLGSFSSEAPAITFSDCVFDVQSLNKTNSVSFSTTNCLYETQPTSLAYCPATPVPYATGSRTSSFTVAWGILTRKRRKFLQLGLFTLAMVCR
jgi:hypothetical protein